MLELVTLGLRTPDRRRGLANQSFRVSLLHHFLSVIPLFAFPTVLWDMGGVLFLSLSLGYRGSGNSKETCGAEGPELSTSPPGKFLSSHS